MTQRRRVKTFQATEGSSRVRFGWNLYQLLPDIWNFVWVLKGLLLNWPKYLTSPNMSKNAKNCFIALATWILRVRRIKLFHWVYLLFWPNFGEVWLKKNIKNRDQTFYWSSFPTSQQFLFFWLRYQYTHFSSALGRSIQLFCNISGEREREPSYPPTVIPSNLLLSVVFHIR